MSTLPSLSHTRDSGHGPSDPCQKQRGSRDPRADNQILPLFFPITYFVLLPPLTAFTDPSLAYRSIPTSSAPEDAGPGLVLSLPDAEAESGTKMAQVRLTTQEKLDLIKPLVLRFMFPLFAVYVEEYVINSVRDFTYQCKQNRVRSADKQGVAPTLVFPLPAYGPWARLFKSPRDYYPFWSLTCECAVVRRYRQCSTTSRHTMGP